LGQRELAKIRLGDKNSKKTTGGGKIYRLELEEKKKIKLRHSTLDVQKRRLGGKKGKHLGVT